MEIKVMVDGEWCIPCPEGHAVIDGAVVRLEQPTMGSGFRLWMHEGVGSTVLRIDPCLQCIPLYRAVPLPDQQERGE